jgi:hypothetical protein
MTSAEIVLQQNICSHLRAYRLQNVIKFKNAVVSGVIAIVCARHGFYLPQGMVDLSKGERCVVTLVYANRSNIRYFKQLCEHRLRVSSRAFWCQRITMDQVEL